MDWFLAFIFGIVPVAFIGLGFKNIFTALPLTFVLWFIGIALHLGAIFVSLKRKSPKQTSTITALAYGIGTVAYLGYCVVQFFLQLLKIVSGNV